MARFIALEYSGDRVRLAVGAGRGDRVVIEHSVTLHNPSQQDDNLANTSGSGAEGGAERASQRVAAASRSGQAIAARLAELGIGRHDAIVVVGRDQIELRQMSLPPCPDDELPELVRFQAAREFHQFDENCLADFIPLTDDPAQPRQVLVAALSPETRQELNALCAAAGLEMKRLVLGPCCSAALASRSGALADEGLTLLIDPADDSVDLTAWTAGRPVFIRTARLPSAAESDEERRFALNGEVRRTIAAIQNQFEGWTIDRLLLVGDADEYAELLQRLSAAFDAEVESFDPRTAVEQSARLREELPKGSEQFAALWGALVEELRGSRPLLDFLNPRRRPPPPSQKLRYVVAAVTAGAVLVGWLLYQRLERHWLEAELKELNQQLKAVDVQVDRAQKLAAKVREIEKWTSEEVIWLDELYRLSKVFPPAKDAMLRQMSLAAGPRGGEIKIEGFAQADAIGRLHEGNTDGRHRVVEKDSAKDTSQKYYDWKFSASVLVSPQSKK